MHEMGIAIEVMKIAMAHLPDQGRGLRVKALNLRIGKLTAIVPESFRFCMEMERPAPHCSERVSTRSRSLEASAPARRSQRRAPSSSFHARSNSAGRTP